MAKTVTRSETAVTLNLTPAQDRFLKEWNRHELAYWAGQTLDDAGFSMAGFEPQPTYKYAKEKGWIGKTGQITAAGFDTAAAFLRR
jgi:hypothetical protein